MSDFKFYPRVAVWEITFACNMRCLHCGTSAGKRRPEELNTVEALKLIDDLAGLGCASITLSGGEPLLREDWRLLAEKIKEHNLEMFIISNGFIMDESTVDDLLRLKFDNIGISFDGTEKTHNHIRQNPKSFSQAIKAMTFLKRAHAPFCAVTQVSSINIDELAEIRRLLIEVGCRLWRIQMTTSTGRMRPELTLPLSRYPQLVDTILEFQKDDDTILVDVGENIGYYGCKGAQLKKGEPYLGCYAGMRVIGIESDGTIKGCLSMPESFVEGNIRKTSLSEIWHNPEGFAYNRKFRRQSAEGKCFECHYLPLCRGGCAVTSVSSTGHRADNPYCIYRFEQNEGILPEDGEDILRILKRFEEPVAAEDQ